MGIDIVRRCTGGRAILHADELTYSVAGPPAEPRLRGGVLAVYHRLSQGLLEGLRLLGIAVEALPAPTAEPVTGSAACFDLPSAHEVVTNGRKLVGSAQCRRAGWILQHGSLPLCGDVGRIVDCLALAHEEERESLRAALRRRAATVSGVLGREVTFDGAASALSRGLSSALNLNLVPGELSEWEEARAAELRDVRYSSKHWTELR
jgi:lipoate-protein ligase A